MPMVFYMLLIIVHMIIPNREDIPEFHNAWIKGHEDGMDHTARPR